MMAGIEDLNTVSGRRTKRLRKESSDDLSIEELFPEDMGYDADIEAVLPDGYEEPESDIDHSETPKKKSHSIDEELAARMKQLGSERSGTSSPQAVASVRGRKRRSLHEEVVQSRRGGPSDIEVVELLETSNSSPPKKRRKRSQPSSSSQRSRTSLLDATAGPRVKASENVAIDTMDMDLT